MASPDMAQRRGVGMEQRCGNCKWFRRCAPDTYLRDKGMCQYPKNRILIEIIPTGYYLARKHLDPLDGAYCLMFEAGTQHPHKLLGGKSHVNQYDRHTADVLSRQAAAIRQRKGAR